MKKSLGKKSASSVDISESKKIYFRNDAGRTAEEGWEGFPF